MLLSSLSVNSPGNLWSRSVRRKSRLRWEGFTEKERKYTYSTWTVDRHVHWWRRVTVLHFIHHGCMSHDLERSSSWCHVCHAGYITMAFGRHRYVLLSWLIFFHWHTSNKFVFIWLLAIALHIFVTTIPCNLSLITAFVCDSLIFWCWCFTR